MKRFFINIVAASIAITAWSVPLTHAATGPWNWTDISGQLSERTNRPVWAIARTNGYWFYTDGQNLSNGGQAYRYDGTSQVTITSDLRNAGIERVDDIVSDNSGTVLFLQDVVRRDNSFKVVAYQSGLYQNLTIYLRNNLQSDEGISSITGRNGTWYVITTKARLLSWNANTTYPTVITLPSDVRNSLEYTESNMVYNVNQGSAPVGSDRLPLGMVPIANNKWLLAADLTNGNVKYYTYDGSSFTDMTTTNDIGIYKLVSNGTTAVIFVMNANYGTAGGSIITYDGITRTTVTNADLVSLPRKDVVMDWDGTSWMIVRGKDLYRLNNNTIESYGRIADYIVTAAGDTNGRFLLGGAVSDTNNDQPTSPLTAKLLMVTEGNQYSYTSNSSNGTSNSTYGTGYGGDRVYTSANGPRVVIQGDPSDFRVGNGKDFSYRVTASDPNGVDRIDLYVNDARIKTCYGDVCEFRSAYWTNGATSRTVKFWVHVTDKSGYSTDTQNSQDVLTVDSYSSATAGGSSTSNTTYTSNNANSVTDSGTGITAWTWLDPNQTTLNANNNVTYNVGTWDANGIKRVEIYVNGSVKRTCELYSATGNQTCNTQIYGNDYSNGANISVNAKVTDGQDMVSWTSMTTLYRSSDSSTSNTTYTSNNANSITDSGTGITAWTWLDPNQTALSANNSVSYNVGTWDANGIKRVEIYVNGSVKRTCDLYNATGNQTCNTQVYANDYSTGNNVSVNARITDGQDHVTWTSMTTLYRSTDSNTTYTSNSYNANAVTDSGTGIATWTWLDPNQTTLNANNNVTYNVGAWDANGIKRVEIYVNGSVKRTCDLYNATGNQTCNTQIYANDYSNGANISVNAKVTDGQDHVTWTGMTTLYRSTDSTNTTNNTSNSSNANLVSSWTWFSPAANVKRGESVTFTAGAWAQNGLNTVDIIVNGQTKRTCSLNRAYGNQECSITINGNDYSAGSNVNVNARVTDANGIVGWSDTKNLYIQDSGTSGTNDTSGTNVQPTVWDYTDGNSFITIDESTKYTVGAWDANGISTITIYVNGAAQTPCSFGTGYGNLTCSYNLVGVRYPVGSAIFMNALVRDTTGKESWTTGRTVNVMGTGTTTVKDYANNGAVNSWSDHGTTFRAADLITVSGSGSDPDGVNRTEIYVNAKLIKSCNDSGSCSATVGPFPNTGFVNYNVTVFDRYGYPTSTGYKQLTLTK
jgi:hypothetical protein